MSDQFTLNIKIVFTTIITITQSYKLAKPSKFLSPQQADGVFRDFAPPCQVLCKRGTHVASHGVFYVNNKLSPGIQTANSASFGLVSELIPETSAENIISASSDINLPI